MSYKGRGLPVSAVEVRGLMRYEPKQAKRKGYYYVQECEQRQRHHCHHDHQ